MTLREKFEQMLFENGMFAEQAKAVMDRAIEYVPLAAMRERWDDDVSGYTQQTLSAVWVSVKAVALQWIDENLPRAWYRPLFEGPALPLMRDKPDGAARLIEEIIVTYSRNRGS